jgi:neutral ceramidase
LKGLLVPETKLKAGFAKLSVTPPFDCEMAGFVARKNNCCGTHDLLWARALVLADEQGKLAIVAVDILGIDGGTVRKIRAEVAARTDIPPERVMISAIHTHAGPATIERGYLGRTDPNYMLFLIKNIAGAIYAADQRLEPVCASVGTSQCLLVGKNRRHPGGPTDPAVSVLRLVQNGRCQPG